MLTLWKSYELAALKLSQPDHSDLHAWEIYAAMNYRGPIPMQNLQEA